MQNKALLLLSLLLSILGIFILLLLNQSLPPLAPSRNISLTSLQDNQKIIVEGKVTREIPGKNSKTIVIDNKTLLYCPDCPYTSYLNKNISALAIIEKYSNKTYAKILKIKLKDN